MRGTAVAFLNVSAPHEKLVSFKAVPSARTYLRLMTRPESLTGPGCSQFCKDWMLLTTRAFQSLQKPLWQWGGCEESLYFMSSLSFNVSSTVVVVVVVVCPPVAGTNIGQSAGTHRPTGTWPYTCGLATGQMFMVASKTTSNFWKSSWTSSRWLSQMKGMRRRCSTFFPRLPLTVLLPKKAFSRSFPSGQ